MGETKGPKRRTESAKRSKDDGDRSILTVVFTDIVDSTARAAEIGDRAWRALLDRHDQLVRSELARWGGNEVDTAGDGFLATFETPAAAIACALAILAGADELGLALRAGMHTGECERRGKGVAGIAVHIAARVAALAGPGEVLLSATVKDLAAGGEIEFKPRGAHALRGVPGRWRLYAASPGIAKGRRRSVKKAADRHPKAAASGQKKEPIVVSAEDKKWAGKKLSVLIVDDHPLWRQTIRSLIERSGCAREVFEAGDGESAIEAVRSRKPDVVMMDMALPGVHGLEATRQIAESSPESRVLVLSSSDDEEQVLEAVQAGAAGYMLKTAGPNEILDGLTRVHGGELVFPPSLAKLVLAELRGGSERRAQVGPLAGLSEREVEVLALMSEGHTNEAVGKTLFLSPKTVERHVTSIFSKLGLDPETGGHRRVLAVIAYLSSARSRKNPHSDEG